MRKRIAAAQRWWANHTLEPRIDVGVALGSSKSVLVTTSRVTEFPSILALDGSGKLVALGESARALEGREPEGVRLVRPFEGGFLNDYLAGRLLLQTGLKKARSVLSSPPAVVLATPSAISDLEGESWVAMARQAGAREICLCSQLVLAAVGAGKKVLEPRARFVVYVGGGNLEVGVVAMGGCLLSHRFPGGGDSLTDLISEYIRRKHHLMIHRGDAEALKCALVCDWDDPSGVPPEGGPCDGKHSLVGKLVDLGLPGQIFVTTREMCELLRPVLEEWVGHVKQALLEISVDWLVDVAEDGILLTGGSARIAGLEQLLVLRLELPVRLAEAPERCVTEGLRQMLLDGELRHAVLSPARSSQVAPQPARSHRLVSGLLAAVLVGCFVVSAHAGAASRSSALSSLILPALAEVDQAEEHWQPQGTSVGPLALLTEKTRELDQLANENRRLWSWLHRPKSALEVDGDQPLLARVVGRDPQGWLSSWTLSAGTAQGVRPGQVVVALSGLVGRVSDVEASSCHVRLLTGTDSVEAGRLPTRKAAGILSGRGPGNLEMEYLNPDAGIKSGDRVYTSGNDGRFPPGIPIGTVRMTQRHLDSSLLTAVVAPAVAFDEVREALILRGSP